MHNVFRSLNAAYLKHRKPKNNLNKLKVEYIKSLYGVSILEIFSRK